jgi:hypothetical protein
MEKQGTRRVIGTGHGAANGGTFHERHLAFESPDALARGLNRHTVVAIDAWRRSSSALVVFSLWSCERYGVSQRHPVYCQSPVVLIVARPAQCPDPGAMPRFRFGGCR